MEDVKIKNHLQNWCCVCIEKLLDIVPEQRTPKKPDNDNNKMYAIEFDFFSLGI